MELVIPGYFFDRQSPASSQSTKIAVEPAKIGSAGKIRCRFCHAVVTDKQQSINHNSIHVHQGSNPAGYSFRFACYQQAPGCAVVGLASYEHSWFTAYSWQIAICKACGEHLGWLFSGETRFYGLIVEKLIFDDQASA